MYGSSKASEWAARGSWAFSWRLHARLVAAVVISPHAVPDISLASGAVHLSTKAEKLLAQLPGPLQQICLLPMGRGWSRTSP
eukprot:3341797-Rhodomonas_salina.2